MKHHAPENRTFLAVFAPAALAVGLAWPASSSAVTITVASEDFESASDPVTAGPDNNPGRWATNGYNHTGITDTEPNLQVLASIGGARIAGDAAPNAAGRYKGNTTDGNGIHMDGIKMFVNGSGTAVAANPGDIISGSFEVFFQSGHMSFGLVTDLAALRASQASVSLTGPAIPVGVSTLNGGAYLGGVTGVINITPTGNTTINRIFNDAGTAAGDALVHSGTGGFGQLVASGPLAGWQRIFFEYVVGDSTYASVGYEQFIDEEDPGLGTVLGTIEDNGSTPIDIGTTAPTQVVGFFISGNGAGGGTDHIYDNIAITIETPETEFTNVVVDDVMGLGFESADGATYHLESALSPSNDFLGTAAFLKGDGGSLIFFDPAGPSTTKVYRILRTD